MIAMGMKMEYGHGEWNIENGMEEEGKGGKRMEWGRDMIRLGI